MRGGVTRAAARRHSHRPPNPLIYRHVLYPDTKLRLAAHNIRASTRFNGNSLINFSHFVCGTFWAVLFLCLSACSTSPDVQTVSIEEMLLSSRTTVLDYETSQGGLVILKLDLPETGSGKFILDTGATTSAIYRNAILPNTIIKNGGYVRIHDMNFSAPRPTIVIQSLFLGSTEIENISFAILDQPKHSETLLNQTKGIIGLDILSAYKIVIDPSDQKISFIDPQSPPLIFDKTWSSIQLSERPFNKDVLGLHFLELQVNGIDAFALVDTGSEFNVMNWNFRRLRKLRVRRKKLRKAWKVNGAIGEFRPAWAVVLEGIEFGNHAWSHQLFSVHHLALFDVVDLGDKPLMIVGMPFFRGKTILIDFENDVMWIKVESLQVKSPALIDSIPPSPELDWTLRN